MKLSIFSPLILMSGLIALPMNAKDLVYVHINGAAKLCGYKHILIKESGYFNNLFAGNDLPTDIDGDFHLVIPRNEQSMRAVWDYLSYGDIIETDPKILYRIKADAEFLRLEGLIKLVDDLIKINTAQLRHKKQKVKIFNQWGAESHEKRAKDLEKQINQFFNENVYQEEYHEQSNLDQANYKNAIQREIISVSKPVFQPDLHERKSGALQVTVVYWEIIK